jgi:hypothetical protein
MSEYYNYLILEIIFKLNYDNIFCRHFESLSREEEISRKLLNAIHEDP